jgi:hypothetical protein
VLVFSHHGGRGDRLLVGNLMYTVAYLRHPHPPVAAFHIVSYALDRGRARPSHDIHSATMLLAVSFRGWTSG